VPQVLRQVMNSPLDPDDFTGRLKNKGYTYNNLNNLNKLPQPQLITKIKLKWQIIFTQKKAPAYQSCYEPAVFLVRVLSGPNSPFSRFVIVS
jgi:hypothetical protein